MDDPLLIVEHLFKYFNTKNGKLHAVDDVSFQINRGATLGMVGESGCGKSTTGRAILRLIEPSSGTIKFDGVDVSKLSTTEMRKMRRRMQMVFQDPFSSLNPRMTVSQAIEEPNRKIHLSAPPQKYLPNHKVPRGRTSLHILRQQTVPYLSASAVP